MRLSAKVKEAVQSSSAELTSSLRRSAYRQGWNAECGRSLRVTCDGETISVSMSQKAEDVEFGWEDQPQPAVRSWANDRAEVESAILRSIDRSLEGVL